MNRIEKTVESLTSKVQEIDFQIKSKELSDKSLFSDGQVFDAYQFVTEIIENAKSSIILIDNYVDSSMFTLLTKKKEKVNCTIYTKKISKQLQAMTTQKQPIFESTMLLQKTKDLIPSSTLKNQKGL